LEQSQRTATDTGADQSTDEQHISLSETFGGESVLREILETVLLTVIIVLLLKTATGQFQVRGSSMEATLHDGQYLIIGKVTYWFHSPQRGDIIVFHPPTHPREDYIKRIVGLPGETINIRSGHVRVDGVMLDEPYISNVGTYSGDWTLGESEYFVLGDNRRNSSDSHSWGVLPGKGIIGKSWLCYWPPEYWGLIPQHDFTESSTQEEQ